MWHWDASADNSPSSCHFACQSARLCDQKSPLGSPLMIPGSWLAIKWLQKKMDEFLGFGSCIQAAYLLLNVLLLWKPASFCTHVPYLLLYFLLNKHHQKKETFESHPFSDYNYCFTLSPLYLFQQNGFFVNTGCVTHDKPVALKLQYTYLPKSKFKTVP